MHIFDDWNYDCYSPAFFNIHMNNPLPLNKMFGSEYESELFHEYLHFLQDTTTTFGITNAKTVFKKILDMILYTKNIDIPTYSLPFDSFYRTVTPANYKLFKSYLQYMNTEPMGNNIIKVIKEQAEDIFDSDLGDYTEIYTYKIFFSDDSSCKFGAHAIMEGICHLLQKQIYHIETQKLQIPYDLSYSTWCQYLPSEKNNLTAFLDLSEASLMFFNPAEIFITTVDAIRKGQIRADNNIYKNIVNCKALEKSTRLLSMIDLFLENYDFCTESAKEIYKADIFKEFKNWLLLALEKGKSERLDGKPLFSSLLILKNYSPEERSLWLLNCFKDFGYPVVSNAKGNIFFFNASDEDTAVSFLTALAVESVYKCLCYENFEGCELTKICKFLNKNLKFNDDFCILNPWSKNIDSKHFCPFAIVWKTWGLSEKRFKR